MDYIWVCIIGCIYIQFLYNKKNHEMEEGISMTEKTIMTEEEYKEYKWGIWEKPVFIIISTLFSYIIVGMILMGWLRWA